MGTLISLIYKGRDFGSGFLPLSDCNTGLHCFSGCHVVNVRLLHAVAILGQGTTLERKHAEIHGARPRRMAGSAVPKLHKHSWVARKGSCETVHEEQT